MKHIPDTRMTTPAAHPRTFVRHPTEMPIRIERSGRPDPVRKLANISLGGLACESTEPLPVGSEVTIEIPCAGESFRAVGAVRWCRQRQLAWELGIQFITQEDAYAARMVEQLCYIERYRQDVKEREGREIDSTTAALEWIQFYAATFPRLC